MLNLRLNRQRNCVHLEVFQGVGPLQRLEGVTLYVVP